MVFVTNLSILQRVQNAAVRLVCSLPRHEHVTSSVIRLYRLPIKFRINFKITMLCFKCIHRHAPNYLKSMVAIKKTSRYNLRSSTRIQLENHSRRSKKTLGDRAFSNASAKIWNNLPQSLHSQQNFNTFKSLLKTRVAILEKRLIYNFFLEFHIVYIFAFYCKFKIVNS